MVAFQKPITYQGSVIVNRTTSRRSTAPKPPGESATTASDTKPAMLNAIKLLRELFQAGAFPRNFAALSTEDVNTWMQQGRAAMSLQSMGRNRVYNDPQKSKFPGRIARFPVSMRLPDSTTAAAALATFCQSSSVCGAISSMPLAVDLVPTAS